MFQVMIGGKLFPVAPEKIVTTIKNQNHTMTLMDGGEINFLRSPGLTELSFTLLLPGREYPFAQYGGGPLTAPGIYIAFLQQIKDQAQPVLLQILRKFAGGKRISVDTSGKFSLERLVFTEDAAMGDDVLAEVSFRAYQAAATKVYTVEAAGIKEEKQRDGQAPVKNSYTVQKGDSLWLIAKKCLGDGARWREIAKENHLTDPDRIYPGQVLEVKG